MPPDQFRTSNRLVTALAEHDVALLAPHFERVSLERRKVLLTPNRPIEHVYFPEDGVVSIVSTLTGRQTEVGIFGCEGVSATCLLLGSDRSPHQTFVQVEGQSALRIDTEKYLSAIESSETLRASLLRFVQTFLIQAAQSTATNAQLRVEARLARWLLMCHDRVAGDEIALTHEFMSMMITAERSGVTVILHNLANAGMIQSKRGRVVICDRGLLEQLAGGSYGLPEDEYNRLIAQFGKSSLQ